MTTAVSLSGVELSVPVSPQNPRGARVQVVRGLTLSITSAQCVAVMGASGAGKSTLLHLAAGITEPTAGVVQRAGGSLAGGALSVPVSTVLQRPESTLSRATVSEEIGASLRMLGLPERDVAARVTEALAWVGLDGSFARRDPLALSGGEQRRVAIAASLALRPAIIMLDEPSAGLDARARDTLHASLRRLHHAGVGVVFTTHDAEEAALLAGRLIVMQGGRVAHDGDPAHVLAVPQAAAALGVDVPAYVRLAHRVSAALGAPAPPVTLDRATHLQVVRDALLAVDAGSDGDVSRAGARASAPYAGGDGVAGAAPSPATPLLAAAPSRDAMDVRARALSWALIVAATFLSASLAGVVAAWLLALAGARIIGASWRSIGLALRPLVVIAIGLFALQLTIGAAATVTLWPGHEVKSAAAFAAVRVVQVGVLLVGALLLGGSTGALEMADGMRFLLAPLRLVMPRAWFEDLTMAFGIGIGATTALEDDLEQLERAQRARGVDLRAVPLRERIRFRALLAVPLVVLALRRSRQLADSLYMRGYRRGMVRVHRRRQPLRTLDIAFVAISLVLAIAVTAVR